MCAPSPLGGSNEKNRTRKTQGNPVKPAFRKFFSVLILSLTLHPAVRWARSQERRILVHGRPLSSEEIEVALKLGVSRSSRVRVSMGPEVPMPVGLIGRVRQFVGFPARPISLATGHGVFLSDKVADNRFVLATELARVAQFEQLGGIRGFLRKYIFECLSLGYEDVSLESEANAVAIEALYGTLSH